MCIVFITTSHPKYPLILIDNRDEYILRPTSRPHWWKHPSGQEVLSSRDLHRPEMGTWLGITKTGTVAVLTNYRELTSDTAHPIKGRASRGVMPTEWMAENPAKTVKQSVEHFVHDGGVKGVGGFSMVCGKLHRLKEGLAIVSNRADHIDDVPIVTPEQTKGWGLTNTTFDKSLTWPKVADGLGGFDGIVESHAAEGGSEDGLIQALFKHLDTDTLPDVTGKTLQETVLVLKHSIFIRSLGDDKHRKEMEEAQTRKESDWPTEEDLAQGRVKIDETAHDGFERGMYGTQRQTVVLVDNDGNVTFVERALWDANGHPITRGEGDVYFRFQVEGWENGS